MSFLCSCAGRRRKRDESDDRQEYYRRRSRSASRTPPLLPSAAPAATPKVKRKFPAGIAPTPSVPSDLEENSAAAVAAAAKKNGKNAKAAKTKDPAAKLPNKTADPKPKTAPKVTELKPKDTSKVGDAKTKDGSKFKDTAKVQFDETHKKASPPQTRTMGTMTAPGAGEVTGYEQTIVPRSRKRSPPAVAAKMEVTLRSTRRPAPIAIPPPSDDICGSSGSDTPTRGYEASVSSSDAASGSPRDAQTQCAFSDFSDDESSLLSLGREEGEYESTVSELRDASADPGSTGQEVWDPGFLQHDRIWMDIKSTLMDLISDKDSPAFQELHESMKPPDLTYCTVFRKVDGTVTHKAREDKKKARHSFGGVAAEKVPGSRSKLNLVALRDEESGERGVRRKSRGEGDGMDYEDLTPSSEYDDKLFTPDDEVTEYYFGRRASSEPDVPLQTSEPQLAPDAKITEFYFGRGASSDLDIPLMKSDSQITLRSFQGGTTSEALRSSMSAIWPAPTREEKIGGSAVELTVPRTETELPDKTEQTTAPVEALPESKVSPNIPVPGEQKEKERLEDFNIPTQVTEPAEQESVKSEQVVEAVPEVKMRQKITSKPFDRSMSESSSTRVVREGTPVTHDLKTQKELWRQGVAFEGKDFDIADVELESMEVEPVSPELHEKNRHHPKRVTRRKDTSQLRSFSLDYEKRSPKVVRKRPGRPIVVQPYTSTRTSLPPGKDHSKHKLKLKHEDRIDDASVRTDDTSSTETTDASPEIGREPDDSIPAVAFKAGDPQEIKSSSPEKSEPNLAPTEILEQPSELRSPSMVRSVITGRFKVETKLTSESTKESQNIDASPHEAKPPHDATVLPVETENQISKSVSQTNQKPLSKISVTGKPKEKQKKHHEPNLLPPIDAESRFVSKPSEVKRSGKIELITPPPDEEESEETKSRRAKKTRNVGRFLPRGGVKELKTGDAPSSYIPQEHADSSEGGRDIKKHESEGSTTEPDLVIGHGSPHGSVDAQLLKFGNSLDESVSKGSPDVIVQCFGEVSATSEEKIQLEEKTGLGSSFDDFKGRENTFVKSATLFSAPSTSVETVISAFKTGSQLLEDDGLGSLDVDDAEKKVELDAGNDLKERKDSVSDTSKQGKKDFTQTLGTPVKDSLECVGSPVVEKISLDASDKIPSRTESSIENAQEKILVAIVGDVEQSSADIVTGNENITHVENDVDPILISVGSDSLLETRINSGDAKQDGTQDPLFIETQTSGIKDFLPSGDSQTKITSTESSAALSDTSSESFPEDLMPLLSPVSASPPEAASRSPVEGTGAVPSPASSCTSPKRISSGSDWVHPLPKVETTVDETPLGNRPPETSTMTTTVTSITTTTKTPRVRLSDIVITGSGEEKLLALSTSPVNDVFLSDVSIDKRSPLASPVFDEPFSHKQHDATAQRPRPTSDVIPKTIGPVSITRNSPEASNETFTSSPSGPVPPISTPNSVMLEADSTRNKSVERVSDILGAPIASNDSVRVVETSAPQIPSTEVVLHALTETRDSLISTVSDSKSSTQTDKNLDVTITSSDVNDIAIKADEKIEIDGKKTGNEESKEKSPETPDKSEGKSGKNGAKVKKSVKKDGKSDKKSEKSDKKTKTKASAKAELPPFPPPDRPIRIAVRPSERMRALSKTSSVSSTTTRTSDSSDTAEMSTDRESIAKEDSVNKDLISEQQVEILVANEASSVTEQSPLTVDDRISTESIPADAPNNSFPIVVKIGDTSKSTKNVDNSRDITTLMQGIIEIDPIRTKDITRDIAEIKITGDIVTDAAKKVEKASPDRDSLDETSSKSVHRTPRDSLEKEIPKETSDITLVSPAPSPKDSLDGQSRRDSELTIDSLHRDSLSDIVPKAKSQSPCDSLDETISKVISESVQTDADVSTPKTTPRDSLEGSPTKSLQDIGPIKRASTVKSVDEDQILSFSSIWSPRISMQQASERVTSPVSETFVSHSAKIVDARPFLAPLYSAENQNPPWISDAVSEPSAAVPVNSPPRDSFQGDMSEPFVSNENAPPLAEAASSSVFKHMSPLSSPRDSFERHSKLMSKPLDRTASSESGHRDDASSISSVTSPRDSLSSKRESSTTISDSRLSTTDTSVIDDILGVGSIPLPKEWTESAPDSPQRTPLRASLAVEEALSSSSATSPRDSFEETTGKRVLEAAPEPPKLSQELSRDTGTSFSPQSTPRDSIDLDLQRKPSGSLPDTPHHESLIDSVNTAGTAASLTARDSFGSEKSSSPRISQKDITESFHKYFSSLDPKLVGLRDSKMSSGSGDSRRSAASDSDFDIIDFTEPDLVVLTDLPEERSASEQGPPTPKLKSTSETPCPERAQSALLGSFDIMYIDTSSFDDDKTPKVTSEPESSPTREVAKVMEELASVLENAEKGFETDTSVSSKTSATPVQVDGVRSNEKEPDKIIPSSAEETDKESAEKQIEKDHDVFRKLAESSMDIGLDVEACFEAMVNSILTPRSSGITDEVKTEESKNAISSMQPGVTKPSDEMKPEQTDSVDPKRDTVKQEIQNVHESTTQETPKHIVPQCPVPSDKQTECKETDGKMKETPDASKKDPKSKGISKDPEDKVQHSPQGETGIRESTFGLAKKVQEILRRTPSTDSQTEECSKTSTKKALSKTSSVEAIDPIYESKISEHHEKRSDEEQRSQTAVVKPDKQLRDTTELEPKDLPDSGKTLHSPDRKRKVPGGAFLQSANEDPNITESAVSLKNNVEKIASSELSIEMQLQKDEEEIKVADNSQSSADKQGPQVQGTNSSSIIAEKDYVCELQKTQEAGLLPEGKTEPNESKPVQKDGKDSDVSPSECEPTDQISEENKIEKTIVREVEISSTNSQLGGEKLICTSEKDESTLTNETSLKLATDSSTNEQTDGKSRTKTKSKSLSPEKTDSHDAFSVAVEKNIPLPPDTEPLEFTEQECGSGMKEKEATDTKCVEKIFEQPKLDNFNESLRKEISPTLEMKENESEKVTDKRRAGDWSKSFSLESQGGVHKLQEEKEKLLKTVRPEVKRTVSSESALEKKTQKNMKGKLVTKSFSRNNEDRTMTPMQSVNEGKSSSEAEPLLKHAEAVIAQAEEDISNISKRISKSKSVPHEDKEKESTDLKENSSRNKNDAATENQSPTIENKMSTASLSEANISTEKEDSGVEDDTTEDQSESDAATKQKKQSSKKSKSRSREDINSEELADLIQKQLTIASGQVDDSQLEWTGPIRREKKSRKSVKTSKSRSISVEEKDAQTVSSVALPDAPAPEGQQDVKASTGDETGSPDDQSLNSELRRFKSKSKSREGEATETLLKDLSSSPESSRKESSQEKPKSILKSSSKEKVPVESSPSIAEVRLSQDDLLSFGDPFTIQKTESVSDALARLDSKSSNEGAAAHTLPQVQDHFVTSSTFEKLRDQSSEDAGDRRSIRKIKSRSSSREDEYPLPDSSFDEKYVTSITESKPREAGKEFPEFGFSEPRSPRSLRRRSSSKSVSFEDDVILESVEDELAEAAQIESTDGKEDLESTADKSRKNKLERRKSPKKKSKSRSSDQELMFDSSFEAIPEDSPIFAENLVNEVFEDVESCLKELSGSRDHTERSKSKSKSVTPEKTLPPDTANASLPQIEVLEPHDGVHSSATEDGKCKIERRKSPKKKSKSKSYDQDELPSSSIPRHLIEERSLRYVVTPDRELGPGVRNLEAAQSESFLEVSTTDAAESGSDFDSFVKERSSKDKIERRKSPKKKSKPKIPSTDEEDITSSEMLIARVDEYFSSISGTNTKGSEGDIPDQVKPFTSVERRKSPKKKSKSKGAENEHFGNVEDATVFENTLVIPKEEQLVEHSQVQEEGDIFGETLGENWLQQPKVERRKSPKKKSKSKSSTQDSDIPKSTGGGDFFLPTVSAFQIDKTEGEFDNTKTSREETQLSHSSFKTPSSPTEEEVASDSIREEKQVKTKSKSRSKSSDLDSDRTIERVSSTHSQSDVEKGETALIFENAATTQTENTSSPVATTKMENIQPAGATLHDRIIVTQDSSDSVRLSSGSLIYPKAIDFFTTITSSRPESMEGQFPLSLPPSRTSLELLAQKSTESLASNVSWNLPPKVDVRTMFVGNVTSPSKADDDVADFFTDPSPGGLNSETGIKPSDSSDSAPGSMSPSGDVTTPKSLSFEDALKAYREKNKKPEDASIAESKSKPVVCEESSAYSRGSAEFSKSQPSEETHPIVSSPIKEKPNNEELSKTSISRTSSASSDTIIDKTLHSFEKSFEIPASTGVLDKKGISVVAGSHSKPPSRVNSSTSEKSVNKTQSFEISIEQPISWDVEHLDLEQPTPVESRRTPINRSSSTASEQVPAPCEAVSPPETDTTGKDNGSPKPSISKSFSRDNSNASEKSVSKPLDRVQKSVDRTTSWDIASFEADSTQKKTQSKPPSRSESVASDQGIMKSKDSFDKVIRQTSTFDVEILDKEPSSPVVLRSKLPSRSSSTTSEKAVSKTVSSFDEAGTSKTANGITETTPTENIGSKPSGVPIAVCAPLRWSAALPENIDLTQDPFAEQERQQEEVEDEDEFQMMDTIPIVQQVMSLASQMKSTTLHKSGDKMDVPHTTIQKEINDGETEPKASTTQCLELETKSEIQEDKVSPKASPVSQKNSVPQSKAETASESTTKTTVKQTKIPSAKSSPAPQKKSEMSESKSTLHDAKVPSPKSSPIPPKKIISSESRSERSLESTLTAAKSSPVSQKKSQSKLEKSDAESRLRTAKLSPVPQKKSQPKSERADAEGRLTAAKSSPVPQRKSQPNFESTSAEARHTAESSPAFKKKSPPKSETANAETRLTDSKSSPVPKKKTQPKQETNAQAQPTATKSPTESTSETKPTAAKPTSETKPTAAKSSPVPKKKTQPKPETNAEPTAAKSSTEPTSETKSTAAKSPTKLTSETKPTAAKSSPVPQKKPSARGSEGEGAVRSAVRAALDAAKHFLGVDQPASRRSPSRSPARGAEPPSASPSARRRRARARRRAAASAASPEQTGPAAVDAAPAPAPAPLDWAAEVEAELPLDEDEAAAPPAPGARRKRKRHRRKRGPAATLAPPAVATPAPLLPPPPPPAPIKRLKSCEEDSSDATGTRPPAATSPRSPERSAAAAAAAASDDDLTPWSVVRSRRQRRLRRDRKSRSADGEGFRFQDPARALRLSSGSEGGGDAAAAANVFYFAGRDAR